ncbi:hypothetical protein F4859DRAFT_343579 [Xylaria cf. heliscus]|nr:hypothetical protein F4859DRAFT_343579 [Xylaria cf. heliscus]
MAVNLLDHLIDDCEDPASYPAMLRYTHLLPHTLQRYRKLLNEQAPRIFRKEPDKWRIRFWDSFQSQSKFPSSFRDCTSVQGIQKYLWCGDQEDPVCRHVFIEANHSMAPLDCSREMLTSLFTFHQVMPQFLDIVLSFGALPGRNVPTASYRCMLQYEHLTDPEDARKYNIPQLGRSGLEVRHCYNLWSVEETNGGKFPWAIRQAGLYHSFDIKNGKATWIHVKANDVLETRIKEAASLAASSAKCLQVEDRQTVHSLFTMTLTIHLIAFEWCNESWRQYMSYWEGDLVEILTKLKEAPIGKIANELERADLDNATEFQQVPKGNSFPLITRLDKVRTYTPFRRETFRSFLMLSPQRSQRQIPPNSTGTTLMPTQTAPEYVPKTTRRQPSAGGSNPYRIFNQFKFHDLQHLYVLRTKFQEADMILKLNTDVLTEMVELYQHYVDTYDVISVHCQGALSNFTQRTNKIIAEMQTERTRITALISLLDDGKSLFDAITNFKNMELSQSSSKRMERLNQDMHQSTLQMKTIAEKTEEETASMHAITIVTLIFLPGTFVATFLGAGFYQWPDTDEPSRIPDYPLWRPGFFYLFIKISTVLMALTLLVWVVLRIHRCISQRLERKRVQGDEEAQLKETALKDT